MFVFIDLFSAYALIGTLPSSRNLVQQGKLIVSEVNYQRLLQYRRVTKTVQHAAFNLTIAV